MNAAISKPSWPSGRKQACFACRQRKKKCDYYAGEGEDASQTLASMCINSLPGPSWSVGMRQADTRVQGVTPNCGLCVRLGNQCLYSIPPGPNGLYPGGMHYMQLTPPDSTVFSESVNDVVGRDAPSSQHEPLSPISSNGRFQSRRPESGPAIFDGTYHPINDMNHVSRDNNRDAQPPLPDALLNQAFWGDFNSFSLFPGINLGVDGITGSLTQTADQSAVSTPPWLAFDNAYPSSPSETAVPSPEQFKTLLHTFIAQCHSLLPCLHLQRLQERISSDFGSFQSSPLFWVIAASGAWHHRDNVELSHGEAWLQRACTLIDKNTKTVKEPLETLQALVYVVYQSYVSAAMVPMWVQLGSACRLVNMLGWNKLDGRPQPSPYAPKTSSVEEKEEQRRVVWSLFLLDRAMSCMAGWPLGMDDRYFMVNYPSNDAHVQRLDSPVASEPYSMDLAKLISPGHVRSEQRGDSMELLFRGYALLGRILAYHNNLHEEQSRKPHSPEFSDLESTLTKFHLLIYNGTTKSSTLASTNRVKEVWLNILIQTCTILLYHPTVEDNLTGTNSGMTSSLLAFERCVNATRNMVKKIKEDAVYNTEGLLNPFLLPAYFLACRFLVFVWHETKDSADRNSIDVILMLIDRIADLWGPLAEKYRKSIMSDLLRNPNDMRLLRRGTGNYLSEDCRS